MEQIGREVISEMQLMKKIAVIGGSYLQLPLVLKAKEIGHEVYCFAWLDGAVCRDYADKFYPISIVDKEEILNVCKSVGIDAVVTIASDLAVITVNYVAEKLGLVGNPVEFIDITTNKYAMRHALAAAAVPCPGFVRVKSGKMPDISGLHFPLIVKPTDRSGSRGVEKIDSPEALDRALMRAAGESFVNEVIVEEYVEGREISVESISFGGKHYVLQITDKVTTGAPYFVELEHHQPSSLPDYVKVRVESVTRQALDALHIQNGASHSEFKIDADGNICVIEIGARMGGDFIGSDLVRLSTGYDFLKGVILVALGAFEEPETGHLAYSGVYFLSKETERLLPVMRDWKSHDEIVRCEIMSDTLKEIHESADRNGYMIYKSEIGKWNCC
ncbi:acetyl-CoA carboxylase biotin carboxylase subunit family protein [uncultured Muribaculum sp.]|uniref:ATP-grasp domain-containing protein n=1 Tax=uncultured Muribaculum sp. TaxID=1918613 RepID=UPI00267478ED|nr:ATP-grasp domain-containing protein [uncultured Muribaculum sp.]